MYIICIYIYNYKYYCMWEKLYLVMLHKIWISHKYFHIIFKTNSNYKNFYENIWSKNLKSFWFWDKQICFILENKNKYSFLYLEKKLDERNVRIVTILDEEYPEYLKEIPNPPYLFYIRWKINNLPKISVVWARRITSYWENAIEKIVSNISNNFIIVSGWATWCDTAAHICALNNWNKTISIIWTWIDIDYPVDNKKLYDKIVLAWWAVISIFPISEVGNSYNFPIRNEIVAWLSVWILAVEAKEKSWTLITSYLALDMWKDLFVVPWDIFKLNSQWCNSLIKKWMAKLVTCADDILSEYNFITNIDKKINKIKFSDKIEEEIYKFLILESLTIDELIKKTNLDLKTISFKVSMMEINNILKKTIWWKYEIF